MTKYRYAKILFPLWIITCLWGLLNLFSASYMYLIRNGQSPFRMVIIQALVFLVCAIFIYFFTTRMKENGYNFMKKASPYLFYITLISLASLRLIGVDRGGSISVISLGPLDFQPMEMFKVTVILYLAYKFHQCKSNQVGIMDFVKQLALPAVGLILIFRQPDLGGFLICAAVVFVALLLNGRYLGRLFAFIGVSIVAFIGIVAILPAFLDPYQLSRFSNWIDPFADAQGTSYQTVQALIGISNGGVSGAGYMDSLQKTFLDSGAATDYIFIVICEEWGIFGAILTIGLIMGIAFMCIMIGLRATERYGQIFATTFGSLLIIQTFVNVAGVINLIPMTGVTLPFISNGMNSLVFLSAGIMACILIDMKSKYDKDKLRKKNFEKQQRKLEDMQKDERRNKRLAQYGG